MNESLPELGDLEREVMQLVWADGPLTAEAVRTGCGESGSTRRRLVLQRVRRRGSGRHGG